MPYDEIELTNEQAMKRAQEVLSGGVLAQLGITLSDPDNVSVRIAQSLADASSVDDLLTESEVDGWEKHEGRSVLIRKADYAPSTKQGGIGIYVIVTARDVDSGEELLLTSGATNVVVAVARLMQLEGGDVPVKLISRPTGNGNTVHRLVKGDPGTNAPF